MKRGFTLVELTIVLVVIGLIIGGILVGQSMSSAARVENYQKNLQKYEIAVGNFKDAYKAEPGGSSNFNPPGALNGNQSNGGSSCRTGNYHVSEYPYAWAQLGQAEMIDKTYLLWQPPVCGGTMFANMQDSAAGGVSPTFAESQYYKSEVGATSNKIPINYQAPPYLAKNRQYNVYLPQYEAIALDNKMDDGGLMTGGMWVICVNKLCLLTWWPDGTPG